MTDRPTGTVTFLLTDIKGSTRLWERHPEEMKRALAWHDEIIRSTVVPLGGYVFSSGGDSFFVAFSNPVDAATAAVKAQRRVEEEYWGDVESLQVRIALDTGLAEERDGDYFGPSLNRAARILSLAAGGQILASHTTADLLRLQLSEGIELHDLGQKRLLDVGERARIFEVASGPTAREPTSRRTLMLAGTAMALLVVLGVIYAVGSSTGGDGQSEPTISPVTEGVLATESREPLWVTSFEGTLYRPLLMNGVVYLAATSDEGSQLHALDAVSGDTLWVHEVGDGIAAGPLEDGGFIFYATVDRLEVVHPITGERLSHCGFEFPSPNPRILIAEGSIYVAPPSGGLYRIRTDPTDPRRCHHFAIQNNRTAVSPPVAVGPLLADDEVYLGDSAVLLWADADDLAVQGDYLPGQGKVVDYSGGVVKLAVHVISTRGRSGIVEDTIVSLVDGEGYLHHRPGSDAEWQLHDIEPTRAPFVSDTALYLVDASGLTSYTHDLDQAHWKVSLEGVTAGPIEADGLVYVGTADGTVFSLDDSGNPERLFQASAEILSLAIDQMLVVVHDKSGRVTVVAPPGTDLAEISTNRQATPDTVGSDEELVDDPIRAVVGFFDGWNQGDPETLAPYLSVDARFVGGDDRFDPLLSQDVLQIFLGWMEYQNHLNAEVHLGDCTTTPDTDSAATIATCRLTFSNDMFSAVGVELEAYGRFFVEDGLIHKFDGLHSFDPRLGENQGTWLPGFYFDDPILPRTVLRSFLRWVETEHAEEDAQACGGTAPDATLSVECAQFHQKHIDEWAATLGPEPFSG